MLTDREIDVLLAEVESTGRVVEVDEVSPDAGQLTTHEADGLVLGDVHPGGVAESDRSLIVGGAARGQPGSPCRLRAARTLRLCGDVEHAQLTAQDIQVASVGEGVQLTAARRLVVGGDLTAGQIVLGEVRAREARLRALRHDVESRTETHENLRSQVKFISRKILKESRSTQAGFDLRLGHILTVRPRNVEVNLAPLYEILDKRGVTDRSAAVPEFFDRVIVGSLTKANKDYIAKNRGRREVFLKLLKELRSLFDVVRQLDVMNESVGEAQAESARILAELAEPSDLTVRVDGLVHPGVTVEFVDARVDEPDEGEPVIERLASRLTVREGETDGQAVLELVDAEGQRREETMGRDELRGVIFAVAEGQVTLDHPGTPEETAGAVAGGRPDLPSEAQSPGAEVSAEPASPMEAAA